MNRLVVIISLLLALNCVACSNACETLVDQTCATHGEESLTCISRAQELESPSPSQERLCERALMLVRSIPESEGQ